MDASIVIPTKNAGKLLERTLEAVFHQKTKYSYEVICVDSGSKDETLDILKKFNCMLFQILPEEFGHGKTRNYGASKGTGEYIIFITQDAVPASDTWLENFINAMKIEPDIVGGFGIHYPYEDCNLLDKRDLTIHFQGFGSDNTIYYLEDKERYDREEGYRHLLAYFSDNNSCLKRSVWEKYPYDDVDFAEDQIWARKMIEMGYKKVYCPFAPVYHSHNYKLFSYAGRYFDEYRSLYKLHKFLIVKKWYLIIPYLYKHIFSDVKYIKSLKNMKITTKLKWINYSFWRNHARYYFGYYGGRYVNYPKFIQKFFDNVVSQQRKQRKQ
ncbi:MAG: glycosyltransferase family 2 protein [Lachnospiraceae bacterium]|jgi:Predicted glycosyltransferases|nr:glycosyltransferase family 2 protein [Lachnospiraceae bacterium]